MRSPDRWWRFSTRDLFAVAGIVAIGVWLILFLAKHFVVPLWVSLSTACVIPTTAIGMLARQSKGAVIGMIIGAVLTLILQVGYVLIAVLM